MNFFSQGLRILDTPLPYCLLQSHIHGTLSETLLPPLGERTFSVDAALATVPCKNLLGLFLNQLKESILFCRSRYKQEDQISSTYTMVICCGKKDTMRCGLSIWRLVFRDG